MGALCDDRQVARQWRSDGGLEPPYVPPHLRTPEQKARVAAAERQIEETAAARQAVKWSMTAEDDQIVIAFHAHRLAGQTTPLHEFVRQWRIAKGQQYELQATCSRGQSHQ